MAAAYRLLNGLGERKGRKIYTGQGADLVVVAADWVIR